MNKQELSKEIIKCPYCKKTYYVKFKFRDLTLEMIDELAKLNIRKEELERLLK